MIEQIMRYVFKLRFKDWTDAVKANVASVMCSYNKYSTTWACENKALLTTSFKSELDFQGYVVSGMKVLALHDDIVSDVML